MNIKPCYDCFSVSECRKDVKGNLDKLVMDRVVNLIYFGEDCFEEGSEEDWGDD